MTENRLITHAMTNRTITAQQASFDKPWDQNHGSTWKMHAVHETTIFYCFPMLPAVGV